MVWRGGGELAGSQDSRLVLEVRAFHVADSSNSVFFCLSVCGGGYTGDVWALGPKMDGGSVEGSKIVSQAALNILYWD
jgi:hypothetical protein